MNTARDKARVLGGRYRLLEPLGGGAQGAVYRAQDLLKEQVVAVKLRRGGGLPSARETAALRALDFPGVVRLLDEGVHEGRALLVMQHVQGESWAARRGPLPWSALAEGVAAALRTLRRVHARGVVHRDLKPGHFIEDSQGEVTLIDFGVASGLGVTARALGGTGVVGDLRYAAPEQLSAPEHADAQSDLFALGMILYEALVGAHPFADVPPAELRRARQRRAPTPLTALPVAAPPRVRAAVDALLQRHRRHRPASASEALEQLGLPSDPGLDAHLQGWSGRRVTEAQLQSLFAGPERVHGLRSAAAQVAWAQAGSDGAALAEALSGWLREGLAAWRGGAIVVRREELQRLRRRADPAPALEALQGPAPERALASQAAQLDQRGEVQEAIHLVDDALRIARARGCAQDEAPLLAQRVHLALRAGTGRALQLGLYELDRAGLSEDQTAPLRALLLAAQGALHGHADLAALAALPPHPTEWLDRWQVLLRIQAAQHAEDLAALRAAVGEGARWAARWGGAAAHADLLGWRGLLCYAEDRMDEAATLHGQAAAAKAHGSGRMGSLANQAAALLDGGQLQRARDIGQALLVEAQAAGHVLYSARAEWVCRAASYRLDEAVSVDWALVEAARALDGYLAGQLLLTELAVAWRAGQRETARGLAVELGQAWAMSADPCAGWLASCLVAALAREPSPTQLRPLAEAAPALPRSSLALQGLGLLFWALPVLRDAHQHELIALVERTPACLLSGRRELMSLDEVRGGLHTPPPPATSRRAPTWSPAR